MKRSLPLAVVLLAVLTACSYQDFRRPVVRNYASDLFYKPQRPVQDVEAQVRGREELALALARWRQTVGPAREPYTVGAGDVLAVCVFAGGHAQPDIVAELPVSLAGQIGCPLLGRVQVAGLSTTEIEEKLARLHAQGFYRDPSVSVTLSRYGSKRILVTGTVGSPGLFTLEANRTTLLEVVQKAGGLAERAGDTAVVSRVVPPSGSEGNEATPQTLTVDLKGLIERSDMAENIWIYPGDRVHVSYAAEKYFYVLGYVRAPGAYILPEDGSLRVMDGIAWARGLSQAGHPERVYLLRSTAEEEVSYRIDLTRVAAAKERDIIVQPGDRIIVRTSWSRRTIDGILRAVGLRTLAPAAY